MIHLSSPLPPPHPPRLHHHLTPAWRQGIVLHYPAVHAVLPQLQASLSAFFTTHLQAPLAAAVTSRGPSDTYVLDVMLVGSEWRVVELNPFVTSAMGHLFTRDYAALRTRDGAGPPEWRLRDKTPPLETQVHQGLWGPEGACGM
jgi:hypothetical protein